MDQNIRLKFNIIFIGLFFTYFVLGMDEYEPLSKYKKGKIAEIVFVNETPIIDGVANDEIWNQAIPITDFIQLDPLNMSLPTQKTSVALLYDHQNIYVLAKLFDDNPEQISTTLALKDDWYEGFDDKADYFRIEFDSRHDHQTAFTFSVNASGVQLDEFVFDDSGYDGDWNSVWDAETEIDSSGWIIEMRIPFSAFRFVKKDDMVWGLNIARYIHRNNEYISWVGYPYGIGGVASKFGHLTGLKKFMIQRKLQFKPYAILGQTNFNNIYLNSIDNFQGNTKKYNSLVQINNIGLDIKYNFNTDVSFETTINPDFGQIEGDPTEINLTAYETYYAEKRPFFVENASIFETPINVFYSRRIGENLDSIPIVGKMQSLNLIENDSIRQKTKITSAWKLVGKTQDGFTYGILRAITHNELTNYDSDRNINKYLNFRIIQDILDGNSYIGLIHSSMTNSFHSSSVYSIDGVFSVMENKIYSDFQFVKSNVNGNSGIGLTTSINYESTHPWEFWFLNSYYDKSFNLDKTGYLWRNNIEEYSLGIGYKQREAIWNFRKIYFSIEFDYANNLNKIPIEKKLSISMNQLWHNYWNTGFKLDYSPKHFDDLLTYDYELGIFGPITEIPNSYGMKIYLQSDERNMFVSRFEWGIGKNEYGDNGNNIFSSLKFNPNINLNFSMDYYWAKSNEKYHWVEITEFFEESMELGAPPIDTIQHFVFSKAKNKVTNFTYRISFNFNKNIILQYYSELYTTHTIHSEFYELDKNISDLPIQTDYTDTLYIDPINENNMQGILLSPNIEPSLYPKYCSYANNIVFHWDYSPGSSLYIVYTFYNGINGKLFTNPFAISSYKIKNDPYIETYFDQSIFIKLNYWFDI